VSVQQRFIAEQQQEKNRVNQRFDEELARLRQLWAMLSVPPATAAVNSGKNSTKN
jgi:hypothetical protein